MILRHWQSFALLISLMLLYWQDHQDRQFVHLRPQEVAQMEARMDSVIEQLHNTEDRHRPLFVAVAASRRHHVPLEVVEIIQSQMRPDLPSWVTLDFLLSLAYQESKFDRLAIGKLGERGLFQIHPAIAERIERGSSKHLFDPVTNSRVAVKCILEWGKKYKDGVSVMAAWRAGDAYVDDAISSGYSVNPSYFTSVSR